MKDQKAGLNKVTFRKSAAAEIEKGTIPYALPERSEA
jgi:hypothetical protein